MQEERQVVRLGRREGVAGDSPVWEVRLHGRIARTDRAGLRTGLRRGLLTGIEEVRRADGDWGPLFGRPVYREVFGADVEPRDHAKRRAGARVRGLGRASLGAVIVAGLAVVLGVPGLSGSALWTGGTLLVAAGSAVAAGLLRLVAAMEGRALGAMADRLVPPVGAPPTPEDWAMHAAEDEIDAYLRGVNET